MQMRLTQSVRHPAVKARRGTSLIEILVVLVILVIGILSIVRLFPAGFIALRSAQNNTFADRLAQGALEALKKDNAALPDAIYMYSDADGFIPTYAPDNFGPYPATGNANAAYNDINKQRYISNETFTVPSSHIYTVNATAKSFPPLHVLNYGPIYLPKDYTSVTVPAVSVHYLHVVSAPWTPQTGDSRTNPNDPSRSIDNPTDVLRAGQPQFLVDYDAGRIAVPPASYPQTFTLVVQPQNAPGPQTVTLMVPAGYAGDWFSTVDTTANGTSLPAGPWTSAVLNRPFFYMGTSSSPVTAGMFTADPYEFVVYDSNFAGSDANPGVLAFNPLASGQAGAQALKARVSYMVDDWHILHEDRNVSAGSPSVRLTLGHLKKIGDVQFDQTTFAGLIAGSTAPADIMLLDLNTGAETDLNGQSGGNTLDSDQSSTTDPTKYQVSYQNGRITFPDNSPEQNVRVFYAGDADWALAIQRAPVSYMQGTLTTIKQTSGQSGLMPNQYVIDAAAERVYFPVCDAGKTVEFDGVSYTNTASPPTSKVIGEGTAVISTDLAANNLPYVNLTGTGLNHADIILDGINTSGANPLTFQAVRGVSAQAVVIWHEHNRWRTRSIDTLLTQNQ